MRTKLAVTKADAPRAVTVRKTKHSTMKAAPGGHRYRVLSNNNNNKKKRLKINDLKKSW